MNNTVSLAPEKRRHPAPVASPKDKNHLILITGASRSGTTLLSRLLGLHSMVHSTNELHVFGDLAADPATRIQSRDDAISMVDALLARASKGIWRAVSDAGTRRAAQEIVSGINANEYTAADLLSHTARHLVAKAGTTALCEHTPRNIFFARSMLEQNRNTKIIHLVRDPRAVLASQKHRWKRGKLDGVHGVRIPLREVIRVYASFHPIITTKLWAKATRRAVELESHPDFMLVRYEDLVLDPDKTVRRVLRFLDLPWEADVLNVPTMGSSHKSTEFTDNGLSTASLERWKSSLTTAEIQMCEHVARAEMRRFAYAPGVETAASFPCRLGLLAKLPLKIMLTCLIDPRRVLVQARSVLALRS